MNEITAKLLQVIDEECGRHYSCDDCPYFGNNGCYFDTDWLDIVVELPRMRRKKQTKSPVAKCQ